MSFSYAGCGKCLHNISSNAERIKGSGSDKLYLSTCYEPGFNATTICANGLKVNFYGLIVCNTMDYSAENNPNCYWFKAGVLGIPYIIGVQGVQLELTNTTDEVMVIKWSESSFSLGTFTGMPFLDGMKYTDANNPSATPDTVIPPNKSVYKTIYISYVKYTNDGWFQGYTHVRADKSLKADVYMKVLDSTGKSNYCSAGSPKIILPQNAIDKVTKK